ncbi:MAG TPA: hypothetical protein VFQ93_04590 [Casimicrobiaceae bacterium]|nr:hypothetical protein [Casimicrobiaceae bacterium]
MKTRIALSIVMLASGLGGCAPVELTKADVDGKVVCNPDRIDAVEREARREHKDVIWLHCPRATLRVVS